MSDTIEKEVPVNLSAADLTASEFPSIKPEIIDDANVVIAAEKLKRETAAKALADKIAARVTELKTYEGKTFARNDGSGLPVKVLGYIGILKDGSGGSYYAFTVEIKGHTRWNPPANDFLNQYHVIETEVQTETNQEPK